MRYTRLTNIAMDDQSEWAACPAPAPALATRQPGDLDQHKPGTPRELAAANARDRLLRRQLAPLPRGVPGTGKRASTTS